MDFCRFWSRTPPAPDRYWYSSLALALNHKYENYGRCCCRSKVPSGFYGYVDFDFYRKAGFGKSLPADKLREFVDRVEGDAAAD